jgi:hypothetical protein
MTMRPRLAHRVGRSSQATPAAVDKSQRFAHRNLDSPGPNNPLTKLHSPSARGTLQPSALKSASTRPPTNSGRSGSAFMSALGCVCRLAVTPQPAPVQAQPDSPASRLARGHRRTRSGRARPEKSLAVRPSAQPGFLLSRVWCPRFQARMRRLTVLATEVPVHRRTRGRRPLNAGVGADSKLSHRADPILSQGWKPTLRSSAVDKCRSLPGSMISWVLG